MAQEQQEWKALGNIVPMMSLNKHINGVPNYSLHDTINMRMSNDRMALQNIEEVGDNEVIMNYLNSIYPDIYVNPLVGYIKGYKILYILPCNNELVLFVWNKSLSSVINPNGSKCVELIRYDERTKAINRVYSALTYYGGKYVGEYTYNVENDLIMAFCEYDPINEDVLIPLRIINLNVKNYNNYDLLLDENKLNIKPNIILSNFYDVYFVSGNGYSGWHYIYIQYKINENRLTQWYKVGFPIKLIEESKNTIFTKSVVVPDTQITATKYGSNYVVNANKINKTYTFELSIDNSFNSYRIGIIVANKTEYKYFQTNFNDITSSSVVNFKFDLNNLIEENFDILDRNNYYNVKNIINYNNKLYISNYKLFNFDNIDTRNIEIHRYIRNVEGYKQYKTYINSFTINSSIYISVDDTNETNGSLSEFIMNLYLKNSTIFNKNKLINNNIKVTKVLSKFRGSGSYPPPKITNYECNIENVFYYIGHGYFRDNELTKQTITYLGIYGVDKNGIKFNLNPFFEDDVYNINIDDSYKDESYPSALMVYNENDELLFGYECYHFYNNGGILSTAVNGIYNDLRWFDGIQTNTPMSDIVYLEGIIIDTLTQLAYNYPNDITYTSVTKIDTDDKSYYKTSLPDGEIFDLYIHFINKYGEISNGYKLYNTIGLHNTIGGVKYDNDYVFIKKDITHFYYLLANVKIKNLLNYPNCGIKYDIVTGISTILSTKESINSNFNNILDKFEYLNLYTNNLSIINDSDLFIPFYNGKNLLFKNYVRSNNLDECIGIKVSNVELNDDIIGYFISYNEPEFFENGTGIKINYQDINNKFIYYSILKSISDFNSNFNFAQIGANNTSNVDDINEKILLFINDNNYEYINQGITLYGGEGKFNRINKSTITTQSIYSSDIFPTLQKDFIYNICKLINLKNEYYLNIESPLFKFSNYYYDNNEKEVVTNNLGELYELFHFIYNEPGVIISQNVNTNVDEESSGEQVTTFKMYDNNYTEYKGLSYNPIYIIIHKTLSLHNYNLKINLNPYNIFGNIYILPNDVISFADQFMKECWAYDRNVYDKYNELKSNNTFNNTILFSNVISDESTTIDWNKFDTEDYKLISQNKGNIEKLIILGQTIFVHCKQAIYILEFKDYLATNEGSLQITESTIKNINYKELFPTDKGYAGLQDNKATIVGTFGYIFYENDTNRILRLDNNQLIHIDYPILEWLQKYKPYKVRFANDVERNNLLIQFNYIVNNEEKLLILLYDYAINTFVSVLNPNIFWFTETYNTKNKLYLLQNNTYIDHRVTYETSTIKCFNNYRFEKNIFKILNQNSEYIELTNKLGFVYNYNYNGIKFLENIMFKLFKYTKSEDPNIQNSIDFTNDPIENIRIPFCGDYVRIYNENIDTGWIDIRNAQTQNFNDRNNYNLPYYYLGDWIMNMFRNIRNKINDINYSKISGKDYTKADDRARLYGNYFIIEFGFNVNNFNDDSNKFEIQSLVVNTTQQTNNL